MVSPLTERLRRNYAPGVPFTTSAPYANLVDMLDASAAAFPDRIALDFLGATYSYAELVEATRRAAAIFKACGVKQGDTVDIVLPNSPQFIIAMFGALRLGAMAAPHNPLSPTALLLDQMHGRVAVVWEKLAATLASFSIGPNSTKPAPQALPVDENGHGVAIASPAGSNTNRARQIKRRTRLILGVSLTAAMPRSKRALLNIPFGKARTMRDALRGQTPYRGRSFDQELYRTQPWPGQTVHHEGAAVALHTGGTTGTPKAVGLSHSNLCSNTETAIAWAEQLRFGCETVYAALPYFHAFGLNCALTAAIRLAATIIVFPTFDPAMIVGAQRRVPVTFFPAVPPMLTRVADKAKAEGVAFDSLVYTICGAMPLSKKVATMWESYTKALIIEGYGMTETSPLLLGSPTDESRRPGALGLPMCNNDIRIVDPENPTEDVAEGEIGELITQGPNVCLGYLGNPEETEALFTSEGWLRTGDLVQVRDGFVYLADRRKELIITGGFNVYPTQVEDVVRQMPGIDDVAVVGIPDEHSGESVVAAIIAQPGVSVDLAQVRQWAEKNLSHYALPRQIVVLSELPRSQIGKVLRRKVREQILDSAATLKESAATLKDQASILAEDAVAKISSTVEQARTQIGNLQGGDEAPKAAASGAQAPAAEAAQEPEKGADGQPESAAN